MKVTVGLLPFYLELYDRILPERRASMEAFIGRIAAGLEKQGLEVLRGKTCRLAPEFRQALQTFEQEGAVAVVTLHLAYSPSLESAPALTASRLPVIVLDTTPDYDFGPTQKPDAIMRNHGIHGVQDLCNLLLRNRKPFIIEAGHWQQSDVLVRVAAAARGCAMAAAFCSTRTGLVGKPFEGMGDFAVPAAELTRLTGYAPVKLTQARLRSLLADITDAALHEEMKSDRTRFRGPAPKTAVHRQSTLSGLALRAWIEQEKLDAFSVNFLHVTRRLGLPVMPFLEISKAMARGIGYGGEGDLLTAALVSALARVYPRTTFTEMFCPDWKGQRIFLSHMGEVNLDLLAGKPHWFVKKFPYTDAAEPVVATGCLRAGEAVFVNLAPLGRGQYRLLLAPGRMRSGGARDPFKHTVHGWFQPARPVADFLADYSRAGGTHHAALVYQGDLNALAAFGATMGWDVRKLV